MSGRSRAIAMVVAGALALPVLQAPDSMATPAGRNGRISYMTWDDDGHWQVWTANPDLSRRRQVTEGPYDNAWAVWSPDGRRLAFDSARIAPQDGGARTEIYTMLADGSDVQQVTNLGGYSYEPAWSPDGDLIAFSTDGGDYPRQQGIYVVRPDGTGLRRILALPLDQPGLVWLDAPRISPDGRSIAYTTYRGGRDERGRWVSELASLWVAGIDGSNPHRIAPWGASVGDADWSPDGRTLVFETTQQHAGNSASVMSVSADGGRLRTLTDDVGIVGIGSLHGNGSGAALRVETSYDPVWAPDGSSILFSHGSWSASGAGEGLQAISPDGTGQHYVSDLRFPIHQVDWGTAPLE